jgi:hypothetical protein
MLEITLSGRLVSADLHALYHEERITNFPELTGEMAKALRKINK